MNVPFALGGNENMADAMTKTVDSTEAPAADAVETPATDTPAVKAEDAATPAAAEKKPEPKPEPKPKPKPEPAPEVAEGGDELDDGELDALDAKVRRRVGKVQRENVNLRGRLKEAESAREATLRENQRLTVALKAGLGGDLLKFLTGDSVEELEKNAADLLAVVGYNGRVTPSGGPMERGSNPRRGGVDPAAAAANETNLDNIGARIYGR